eukprot:CAMPEP_0198696582 /NCGR_PEP_ID=MMETSP1468-20131203/308910_1 /TAXON_ID=1461545 /ORGANISM="Mantoniella sp, Strain CCMP1436" /LENGTH=111 /DNA_ID=CAMNT_0044452907 /DNA_START=15 /DNA_END=348 /DNA_ORIENTATION=-
MEQRRLHGGHAAGLGALGGEAMVGPARVHDVQRHVPLRVAREVERLYRLGGLLGVVGLDFFPPSAGMCFGSPPPTQGVPAFSLGFSFDVDIDDDATVLGAVEESPVSPALR